MSASAAVLTSLAHEALELSLATSAACLIVLLVRRPVRTLFGARVAYALWWLLPAAMLAVLLPAPAIAPAAIGLGRVSAGAGLPLTVPEDNSAMPFDLASLWPLLAALWLAGCGVALARIAMQQRRFRRALGKLAPMHEGLWRARAANTDGLPAVVGLRARIVLPADFEHRYAPEQQALVLAHERVHVRRGDVYCNLGFALLCALQWFNPLLRLAQRAYRLDQELACDACVLAMHPRSRLSYGKALLGSSSAFSAAPLGCPAFGTHPLKERITMLTRPLPSIFRLTAGFSIAACIGLSVAGLAWSQQPARAAPASEVLDISAPTGAPAASPPSPTRRPLPIVVSEPPKGDNTEVAYRKVQPPKYPAEAIQQRQEGEVLLKVQVLPDGSAGDLQIERSTGSDFLDRAALDAVAKWAFHAAKREGRAVESWIAVPVRFSLDKPAANAGEPSASLTPPSYGRLSPPTYPAELKASGGEGTTLLKVGVDAVGAVQTVDIESSSGYAALDRAASDAVERSTFNPARIAGQPVASQIRLPVQFIAANSTAAPFVPPAGALDTITLQAD
ncbi:TonB family protein [Aquimonas voraii]|uniref:Outer membrane transport energization protein TonB n=1 Tax=Aquimonas voraii TaxID=265719 RepID=A0A1G6YZM1_9GAMM|nr:TonB family protein [Aquimonas voraii]SDD95085.1 outer membrane transport energization protein TonB [Aquimonas voraii]